jgi:hypothetical protein
LPVFHGDFAEGRREAFKTCLEVLKQTFGRVYADDNLIALQRSAGFASDERFRQAFVPNAKSDQDRSLAWRLHTLTWAAEHCLGVEGDFVECGVYKGFSFSVIADYVQWDKIDRRMYLYDTFQGIPDEFNSEGRSNLAYEKEIKNDRDAIYNIAVQRFNKYPNVSIIRGAVPESFSQSCPERIAFIHIDMNSAKSEIAALDALWDRVTPGGAVVFDDYGWSGYAQQKVAEDAWMAARGYRILEIPTGQGLVIKKPT